MPLDSSGIYNINSHAFVFLVLVFIWCDLEQLFNTLNTAICTWNEGFYGQNSYCLALYLHMMNLGCQVLLNSVTAMTLPSWLLHTMEDSVNHHLHRRCPLFFFVQVTFFSKKHTSGAGTKGKYLSNSVVLIVALLKISKDGCVQWLSGEFHVTLLHQHGIFHFFN